MMVIGWLRRLLPILAVAGLVVGPFAAPLNGAALAAADMTGHMSHDTAHEPAHDTAHDIAHDMACCPDSMPAEPDCQTACPLMAACASMCFSPLPPAASIFVFAAGPGVFPPGGTAAGDSVPIPPPAQPPRT